MNYKASDVDGSWATTALHQTIKEFNEQSDRQTRQMLNLTRAIAWLTAAMLAGLFVQICLAIWPPTGAFTPTAIPASNAPKSTPTTADAPAAPVQAPRGPSRD